MQCHGKHRYAEKYFLSKGDPFHRQIKHDHEKDQVAEPSKIEQAHGIQSQESCHTDTDGLGHIGKGRGGNRRIGGADISSHGLNLSRALRRVLPVEAKSMKQLVGGFFHRFPQFHCLFPALGRHLQVSIFIRLIHEISVQIFHPGVLSPQKHPAVPVTLGLPGHLGGKAVSTDVVADLIRRGEGRQNKEIQDAKPSSHQHSQL